MNFFEQRLDGWIDLSGEIDLGRLGIRPKHSIFGLH